MYIFMYLLCRYVCTYVRKDGVAQWCYNNKCAFIHASITYAHTYIQYVYIYHLLDVLHTALQSGVWRVSITAHRYKYPLTYVQTIAQTHNIATAQLINAIWFDWMQADYWLIYPMIQFVHRTSYTFTSKFRWKLI